MDLRELRIGIYVKPFKKKHNGTLASELDFVCLNQLDIIDVFYEGYNLETIPLTEEWLIKFGLYNNLKLNYNKRQGVEYRFNKKKLGTYIIKRYYNNSLYNMQFVYDDKHNNIPNEQIWVNIKYVHQLQNLYFALTGKELQIKE